MTTTFDLQDFHERAVRTPSHDDVGPMRDLLCDALRDAGVEPEVDDAGNVLAVRSGGSGESHLVLNTHLDTVGPHVPFERRATIPDTPHDSSVDDLSNDSDTRSEELDRTAGPSTDDVVVGRGACDAKGPLAAFVDAFLGVDVVDGRVTLAVTPDEETESTGAAALDLDADGYLVGEPTGLDVCNAAKGRFEGTVTVRGESAHAAEPGSGANAVRAAGTVLTALSTYDDERGPGTHRTLGAPTLTPTVIQGGGAANQIPETCRITIDRRSVPPETAEEFAGDFRTFLTEVVPSGVTVEFAYADRSTPFLESFATSPEDPFVATLQSASGGTVRPFAAATEASYFANNGPAVVFGPGELADDRGAVAHSRREYVRSSEVERAARAVRDTLSAFVGENDDRP